MALSIADAGARPKMHDRPRLIGRALTSILLHTTALAAGMLGLPVLVPRYSRVYAAASCTQTPTGTISGSTSFSCTVPEGSVTQPQIFYTGYGIWYHSGPGDQHITWPGLPVTVTNHASIVVTGTYSTGSDNAGNSNYVAPLPVGKYTDGTHIQISSISGGLLAFSVGNYAANAGTDVAGGAGGAVTVNSYGSIRAKGFGIVAYSSGQVGGTPKSGTDVAGDGGAGGTVNVLVTGQVTAGSGPGVLAGSYGGDASQSGKPGTGDGGTAGDVLITVGTSSTAAPSISSSASGWFRTAWGGAYQRNELESGSAVQAVSYGGTGYVGSGGDGGDVGVKIVNGQNTAISSAAGDSPAILALSQGGSSSTKDQAGGAAGTSTVYIGGTGTITTSGDRSAGIVVQSLGGTGFFRGKKGALGGTANDAIVENSFDIRTGGSQSHGIVAQSAGAGGGIYSYAGAQQLVWGDQNINSYGGSAVSVTNTGAIETTGPDANGIVAQSIGGGGGHLDMQISSAGATIGGSASNVGGNDVTVRNTGSITTLGQSYASGSGESAVTSSGGGIGILAQSIGGGGGSMAGGGAGSRLGGAGTGSTGGYVGVTNSGKVSTAGEDAHGILAQSVGGGGGQGRNSHGLFVAVGGTGGTGGDGGEAAIVSTSAILVSGDYANGLMAQSIGGGGGTGGKAVAIGLFGLPADAHGGSGGAGGAGGDASVATALGGATTTDSSIVTKGTNGAGILVQSVGGGGGSGGAAKSISAGVVGVSLAFGGSGSGGGAGGRASAVAAGNVTTYGYDSMGVVVQSVGGGGGQGGTASAKSFSVGVPIGPDGPSLSAAVSVAHGGSGGTASNGGYAYGVNSLSTSRVVDSTITTSANQIDASTGVVSLITIYANTTSFKGITTFGDGSTGMLVQSVGGGGGAGGDATANSSAGVLQDQISKLQAGGDAANIESINVAVDVALGGTAGGGGNGGIAYGRNVGTITTFGLFADGMSVQSIGGGGGTGGTGNAKTKAAGDISVGLNVALGATGGAGGNGGVAFGGVEAGGLITTYGNNSNGMLVQSVGGGGGNAGGGGGSTSSSFGLSIGLGANGATGGGGGNAYAWNKGTIVTRGDASDGMLVQSVGGGGGNGGAGDSSLTVTSSAKFSDAYSASGTSTSTTDSTNGDQSKPTSDTFGLSLGTKGGGGGDAGTVVLGANAASGIPTDAAWTPGGGDAHVRTYGNTAHGLVAQSIGGGGGNAAIAPNSSTATATLDIGAKGGGGGAGGDVFVYAANVTTSGFSSHGVLAQSVGGGGGIGVASGISGTISTSLGSENVTLETGADAGSSNNAGAVLVTTAAGSQILTGVGVTIAGVQTNATDSFGILAQSIGGGGGTEIAAQGSSTASSGQGAKDSHSITLGGKPSASKVSADGGRVAIYHQSQLITYGARGFGVVAQSIGGGGGMVSGDANSMSAVTFAAGSTGDGGLTKVGLSNGASITTFGDGAFGVLAQSIGGGGGFSADSTVALTSQLGPSSSGGGSGTGYGGNVYVMVGTGTSVTTRGSNAHGIFAQSVSGGGGVWDDGTGMVAGTSRSAPLGAKGSGIVAVNVEGSVNVSGAGSWGVYAQNSGPNSLQNPVTVTVSGTIAATGSAAGAVRMLTYEGQSYLKTTETGSIAGNLYSNTTAKTAAAPSAAAIVVPQWNPRPVTARFVNEGTFVSDRFVTGMNLTNNGSLSIAGPGEFGETTFSHNIDGTGRIVAIDADFEHGNADRIIVGGEVGGRQTLVMKPTSIVKGGQVRFLQAGKIDAGALVFQPDSVFRYELVDKDGWKEIKVTGADFVGKAQGFDKNAQAAAKALQGAFQQAGTEPLDYDATTGRGTELTLGNVFAQFEGTDASTLKSQLQAMQPFAATLGGTTAPRQGIDTANGAMSCPAFEDEGTILLEGQCVWIKGTGNWTDRSNKSDDPGYRTWAVGTALGGQKEIAPNWFLGGTAAYARSDTNFDGGNESVNGQTATGAVALKRQLGPWLLGGAVGGGYTWADSKRDVALGTASAEAKGSPDSSFLFARARVAYEVPLADWYLWPMVDLDVINFHQQSYEESGAGALNLDVDSNTETYFAATPGIELGGRLDLGNGFVLRPFTGVGVSFITNDNYTATSNFAAAPDGPSLQTTSDVDNVLGRLTVGLDLMRTGGFEVKLDYNLQAGDKIVSQTGQIRFGYYF